MDNDLNNLILTKYKTFAVHTLGCKVNLYESEIMINQLRSIGMMEVDFDLKADIYIINTCSVTNTADAKSRHIIQRAHRLNPKALVIVCGCYSQNYYEEIKQKLHADIIIGNKYKNSLLTLIGQYLNENKKLVKVNNLMIEKELEFTQISDFLHKTRAFIKIQDGCNFMCSYCSIPFSRGRQRSVSLTKIIDNIKLLVANGYKEIVLTGVNTAGYENEGSNFYDLLKQINDLEGDFRVRISSVEPFQITDEIISLICTNQKRFCNHWHICLQSGDSEILSSMNRKYTTEFFLNLVNKIYKQQQDCSISTDVIVGFPGEDENSFTKTFDFINECAFSFLHVFPYSKRKFTKAANMPNQIKENEKHNRVKKLLALSDELKEKFLKRFVNKTVDVLWEKIDGNLIHGKTSEYCDVVSDKLDIYKVNTINSVKVIKLFNHKLIV